MSLSSYFLWLLVFFKMRTSNYLCNLILRCTFAHKTFHVNICTWTENNAHEPQNLTGNNGQANYIYRLCGLSKCGHRCDASILHTNWTIQDKLSCNVILNAVKCN